MNFPYSSGKEQCPWTWETQVTFLKVLFKYKKILNNKKNSRKLMYELTNHHLPNSHAP
jgi:uncharacterized protein YcaQ